MQADGRHHHRHDHVTDTNRDARASEGQRNYILWPFNSPIPCSSLGQIEYARIAEDSRWKLLILIFIFYPSLLSFVVVCSQGLPNDLFRTFRGAQLALDWLSMSSSNCFAGQSNESNSKTRSLRGNVYPKALNRIRLGKSKTSSSYPTLLFSLRFFFII